VDEAASSHFLHLFAVPGHQLPQATAEPLGLRVPAVSRKPLRDDGKKGVEFRVLA